MADLAAFDQLGDHEYDPRVLLPHHAPEVDDGVGQAALRRDVVLSGDVIKVRLSTVNIALHYRRRK